MPILSWFNRDEDLTRASLAPYRLLEPVKKLNYGDADAPNMLIQGDNLEALKALRPYYGGEIKCIFIDPPYNTKSAVSVHYDDNIEHAQWLSLMYPRLELLNDLLADDGSIWVAIDDSEGHYLKIIMDEIFGRKNFVANVVWQSSDNSNNDAKTFSGDHNHLLVYSKRPGGWLPKKLDSAEKRSHFSNPDNDPRGPYFDGNPLNSPKPRPNLVYTLTAPNGNKIKPPKNGWRWEKSTLLAKMETGEIRWNATMTGIKRRTYLADMQGLPPSTLWTDLTKTGHNRQAKSEQKNLAEKGMALFETPKPERLIKQILEIATEPGDRVLDSFLGSGTTAAVAHKMGRRWIGIEMGEHARSHCLSRMQKVVDGDDIGISEDLEWEGGGGFRFYKLGAPVFDDQGHIREGITFEQLAAHVWFAETGTARSTRAKKEAFLGEHKGLGYYLLFNGILGDERPEGGNVLTKRVLRSLPAFDGPKIIYAEACLLNDEQLAERHITFRQTPYDLKAR